MCTVEVCGSVYACVYVCAHVCVCARALVESEHDMKLANNGS
jgi:hypothetical protein